MLKASGFALYGTGCQRGSWWKWKIEPFFFDGVMLYAQPGHGRCSNSVYGISRSVCGATTSWYRLKGVFGFEQ